MIDKELVKSKIEGIQADLEQLARFKDLTFDQIAKDYDTHKIVERILEVVINGAIDINQHLLTESNLGRLPFDFRESFLKLVELKVYPLSFAQEISQSVGLRNILVHQYRRLDEEIFYASIKKCLTQYVRYCQYILDYLEKAD